MAKYSVANTKDNLSKLIDKALAGEEVIITRHGKPAVELRVIENVQSTLSQDARAATERLRAKLDAIPRLVNTGRPLMEQIKDEYESRF
jgi:antitoxin (DNA-binding transcriptional repressor) of toxin-antitoxin stability system